MKYDNLRAFEKHIQGSTPLHFADVYVVICAESFRAEEAVELLVQAMTGDSRQEALASFDGESAEVEAVFDELNTLPLFVEKKVVLLRRADKLKRGGIKLLEPYMDAPNPRAKFIFTVSSLAANTRVYKKSEQAGVILSLAARKPWEKEKELSEWLIRRTQQEGKKMDPSAVRMLVGYAGGDQGVLNNELLKLVAYVGDKDLITSQDVAALSTKISDETGWQLAETIFSRQVAAALHMLHHLLLAGEPLLSLVAQLRSQLRTQMLICAVLHEGGTPQDITQRIPYLRGQLLQKKCQAAREYGLARCRRGLLALDETDRLAKSSTAEAGVLMERLVIQLTEK